MATKKTKELTMVELEAAVASSEDLKTIISRLNEFGIKWPPQLYKACEKLGYKLISKPTLVAITKK